MPMGHGQIAQAYQVSSSVLARPKQLGDLGCRARSETHGLADPTPPPLPRLHTLSPCFFAIFFRLVLSLSFLLCDPFGPLETQGGISPRSQSQR